ncbi:MAG TPA: glycosyltransferase family 4 protein [Bryobacteraceae bacterium]
MTPQVLVSHPFGNPNAYQAARGLHLRGSLAGFATCIYAPWGTSLRSDELLPKGAVRTGGWREGIRVMLANSGVLSRTGRSVGMIDWVARAHDVRVARQLTRRTDAVWGYEDFAAHSFERAKALGIGTIYDLPTVHHMEARRIYEREVEADPSLARFLSPDLEPEHRIRRKEAELELADVVVCASTFVKGAFTKRGWPASRLKVLPYGVSARAVRPASRREPGPLRLLYAGAIGPHKGIHHLFQALCDVPEKAFHLTLAGAWVPGFREWVARRFRTPFHSTGRLPAAGLSAEYEQADVLVFPALRDGFGLVLVEAMAHGVPAIASTSCAAPDLVRDGIEGLIVPPSNPVRIREAIETLLDRPQLAPAMSDAAYQLSRRLTWESYQRQVVELSHEVADGGRTLVHAAAPRH